MKNNAGQGILLLFTALMLLVLPLRWMLAALLAAAVHELGHIAAVYLCGGSVRGIWFFHSGAVLEAQLCRRWEAVVAIMAGPAAGLLLLLFCRWMPRTAICGCFQSIFNLLPIYPLDGGRLLRCLGVGKKACRWVEIAVLGVFGCGITLVARMGILPVALIIMMLYRVIQEKFLAKRRNIEYNRSYHRK